MTGIGVAAWLGGLSIPVLVAIVFVVMVAVSLGGHGIRRFQNASDGGDHSQEGYLIGSALGFLALLMAFSFSMALGRYEERRHLVVQEANAIGTAYLRAQLLDEPHRSRLSGLLFQYTANRIALGTGNHSGLDGQIALNDRLLTDIWAAVTAARDSAAAHGISTPLLTSYNEVIDLDTERKMARQVRLPAPLTLMLFGFLLITAAVLGYVLEERRAKLGAFVLFFLLALYVGIIADLSRPAAGFVRESQEPMLALQASLRAQPPQSFDKFGAKAVDAH
jgi:hypothetical protein